MISNSIPPETVAKLKKRKKAKEARGEVFKLKQPRQREPRGLEKQYASELRKRMTLAQELVDRDFIPRLDGMLRTERDNLPTFDDLSDDVFTIINGIEVRYNRLLSDSELRAIIRNLGLAVSAYNLTQFRRVLRQALSVDPFSREAWLVSQMKNFVEQNVALIKSVDKRYFSEIQEVVFRGARQGLTANEIAKNIRARAKVGKRRAELIARDQVNKFNGQLARLRQQQIGVKEYRWRTSQDERVRDAHRAREGKVFKYSEPPEDGHPGEPINCRCYPEPVLEELLEE